MYELQSQVPNILHPYMITIKSKSYNNFFIFLFYLFGLHLYHHDSDNGTLTQSVFTLNLDCLKAEGVQ